MVWRRPSSLALRRCCSESLSLDSCCPSPMQQCSRIAGSRRGDGASGCHGAVSVSERHGQAPAALLQRYGTVQQINRCLMTLHCRRSANTRVATMFVTTPTPTTTSATTRRRHRSGSSGGSDGSGGVLRLVAAVPRGGNEGGARAVARRLPLRRPLLHQRAQRAAARRHLIRRAHRDAPRHRHRPQ